MDVIEKGDSNQNIKSVKSKYPSDWSNNQSDWSKEQDDKTRFDSNKNVNQSKNQTSHNILISRFFARILDSSLLTAAYFIYWVIDLERRSYFYVNPNIDINTVLNGLKIGFWGILKFHSQKIFFLSLVFSM